MCAETAAVLHSSWPRAYNPRPCVSQFRSSRSLGVIVASGSHRQHAQTRRDAAACAALTSLQIPGIALSITKAEWFAEGSSPAGRSRRRAAADQASGLLPRGWRARSTHGRRRQAVRHRLRARTARRLERPLPVSGRRRLERQRADAARAPSHRARRRRSLRGFAVVSTDTGHTGQSGFDASFMQEQQAASTSRIRPSDASRCSPSRSSRSTTPRRPIAPTSPAARPAAAKRC